MAPGWSVRPCLFQIPKFLPEIGVSGICMLFPERRLRKQGMFPSQNGKPGVFQTPKFLTQNSVNCNTCGFAFNEEKESIFLAQTMSKTRTYSRIAVFTSKLAILDRGVFS